MPMTIFANIEPSRENDSVSNCTQPRNPMRYIAALGIAAFMLASPAPSVADHDDLASFGHRDLGSSSMPLLTILLDFNEGNFSPGHDAEFYRRLMFSGSGPIATLAGRGSFYAEQSSDELALGAFVFENAGIIGPFFHPDDPLTPGDERDFACARGKDAMDNPTPPLGEPGRTLPIAPCGFWRWNADAMTPRWDNLSLHETLTNAIIAADLAGFPFSDYDVNGDNVVDEQELAILVIFAPSAPYSTGGAFNNSSVGGAVRKPTLAPFVAGRSGLRVNLDVATVGENASAGTIVHELAHLLQKRVGNAYEGYGKSGVCVNNLFTTMSCTILSDADNRDIYHLDPYTKMRFGFLKPEIAHLNDSLCLTMQPIEDQPGVDLRSLILYDPDRGPDEYFMLEYRRPLILNYDGDPFGTGSFGLPDTGLGIWYVQIQEDGSPVKIDAFNGSGDEYSALYLVPPDFADDPTRWGFPTGVNGLWGPADGAATLTWPDGTNTGTEVQVIRQQGGKLLVQVDEPGGLPCLNIPKPSLTEFLPVDDGVDVWDNGTLSVTRRIGTPIVSSKLFTVEYELVADQDTIGPVFITDDFSGDFLSGSGQKPSLAFPPLVQGQPVTLSYTLQASESGGGYDMLTTLIIAELTDNPQQPGNSETFEIQSFISVWDPNAILTAVGDNLENDGDGDDIPDSDDKCPNQDAYGFDSDRDGCIDTIGDIDEVVDNLSNQNAVRHNILKSLSAKTQNAKKSATKGNYQAAIGVLGALINQVRALEVKEIPEYEAYLMRSYAQAVQSHFASIGGPEQ